MKVILYMAVTVNGMIAKENDDTSFVSDIRWEDFENIVRKAGNMIIGRRAYDVMKKNGELKSLGKIKVFVLTHDIYIKDDNPNIIFTDKEPKALIESIQDEGFDEILITGGGNLNALFMKENLIDEIILDVEPKALGKGIKIFEDEDFETDLEIMEFKSFSPNGIQLHYKIKK